MTMHRAQESRLINFFSSVFHQDWDLEGSNTEEIVDAYMRESEYGVDHDLLCEALLELSQTEYSDSEIRRKIIDEYGSCYNPTPNSMGVRDWLCLVRDCILRHR